MNIRQIISEAIDRAVLARYASNLEVEMGRIDNMDLSTINPLSFKYVSALYVYASDIVYAIRSNRIMPPRNSSPRPASTNNKSIYNPNYNAYERDSFKNQAANFVKNAPTQVGNFMNDIGIQGTGLMNGVWQTAVDTTQDYYTKNKLNKDMQQAQAQAAAQKKSPRRVTKRKPSGADLTTLCGSFQNYKNEYGLTNSRTGNELARIRPVTDMITIIENIKNALRTP